MLRRLRLVDFKSFADEAVELAPLTLLVGANASGKSNCLDALHEGTIMRRLGDLPRFEETLERTGIDELFATGWLEMAL